ncbi:orotidine-5'-phosphate decarboxylase [Candidatus Gottesmanbacteria bacterium]|nr:orotidine-5'-phosphate decarboxylase [Candidatus Gottesmanbacteria bacterium]
MSFQQKLDGVVAKQNSLLCIGLDSDIARIPDHPQNDKTPQFSFNKAIIDATHDLVCAYKPNTAFYEARGAEGISELKMTCDYLHEKHPDIVVILDAKRGDIGNTNAGYVTFAFDWLGVDAITLHPYLGKDAILPFLERKDKGCIILCRTSNPGAGELQDIEVRHDTGNQAIKLYQYLAKKVVEEWNINENCGLVVGATCPGELEIVRRLVKNMPLLIPGIGAQGGDLEKTVKAGVDSTGKNAIINSSRAVIFAGNGSDFDAKAREAAMRMRDEINRYRL